MSYDASGRTDTKRERKLFLIFSKMSVTRCGRPDRHNKTKENIFRFLDFFLFFVIFYNLNILSLFNFFLKERKEREKKGRKRRKIK